MLEKIIKPLLELIFPSNIYCIYCERPIDSTMPYSLCGHCVRILQWVDSYSCSKCGKPLYNYDRDICRDCSIYDRKFNRGFTTVRYGRVERDIVHQFKYGDKSYYGEKLAQLMYERILSEDIDADLILAVPMYKQKERRRGYNQAALLARALARNLDKPYSLDLLMRNVDTRPMSSLGAEERKKNLEGAFSVDKDRAHIIKNKTILLVDDIFTTGSTVNACSEVLLESGASSVYVLTFAAGA